MNTLPNVYELFHFNLTMFLLNVVKLKITQKQLTATAVPSVEPIVAESRSMFVSLFLENSF